MAIESANTFATNRLATMVAVRAAEEAAYLTVGSKAYFKNQLADKNNGQDYDFFIKDVGGVVNRLAYQDGDKNTLTERKVTLSLDPWHILVTTNSIEKVTDVEDWEDEIARPNGVALIQGVVRKTINNDLGKIGAAFIGSGFTPLSQANAHVASVANGELYSFCSPQVEAVLTSNGQQFVPVDAPDMYSKGLLGRFHGSEFRAQRFFPTVVVSQALANAMNASKVTGAADNGDKTFTITASGFTAGIVIPKGYPLFIDGVKACDCVGDVTDADQCFVVLESVTTTGATVGLKVAAKALAEGGTREIANSEGVSFASAANITGNTWGPDAGKYYMGITRADGAEEFETLDKLDAAGADYEKSPTVAGINVHQNRLVDLRAMTNDTRWDIVTLAGCVEPRAVAAFYVK